MIRIRATYRNEGTSECPWFVYICSEAGGAIMACRFDIAMNAQNVTDAINDALRDEGRLLIWSAS